jgi:hypothetical protein
MPDASRDKFLMFRVGYLYLERLLLAVRSLPPSTFPPSKPIRGRHSLGVCSSPTGTASSFES